MKTSRFISRSTVLPVTISGVKEHLGIYHSEKDENLKILMEAACNAAEQFTGQPGDPRTYGITMRARF